MEFSFESFAFGFLVAALLFEIADRNLSKRK